MIQKLMPVIVVLALSMIACGFQFNVPTTRITPGPLVTEQIDVPLPPVSSQAADVSLAFGAGTFKLHSGATGLVSGTAIYNVPDFKPTVTINDSSVRIEQGNWRMTGIPDLTNIKNDWDLSLGSQPLALSIEAGAYQADYQLGGLALTSLTVKDGAADVKLNFASPNLTEMSRLDYETGASNVTLTGLGNANFTNLTFQSGAGRYRLDFTGALKRDGNVKIVTGISDTTLVIPSGIPVQLSVEGGLSNVSFGSGWTKNGSQYTQTGSGPQLTVVVQIGAGNLTLTQ